jgi:hypothetical protein
MEDATPNVGVVAPLIMKLPALLTCSFNPLLRRKVAAGIAKLPLSR